MVRLKTSQPRSLSSFHIILEPKSFLDSYTIEKTFPRVSGFSGVSHLTSYFTLNIYKEHNSTNINAGKSDESRSGKDLG